jgi:hypothetical protein
MLTKAIPVLILLVATYQALGANPFLGNWKVSAGRSLQEAAPSLPMNLTADYKLGANGDLLVTMTAFRNNQTVHTEIVKNYVECDGSEQQLTFRQPPGNVWPEIARFRSPTISIACNKIGVESRALDVVLRSNGKLVASSRRTISESDGFIIEVKTGITPSGEYYRWLLVWERK